MRSLLSKATLIVIFISQYKYCISKNVTLSNEKFLMSNLIPSENPYVVKETNMRTSDENKTLIEVSPDSIFSNMDVYFKWRDEFNITEYIENMENEDLPGIVVSGSFWGWMPVLVVLDSCMGIGCYWGTKGMTITALAPSFKLLICGLIGGHFLGELYVNYILGSYYVGDIDFYVSGFIFSESKDKRNLRGGDSMKEKNHGAGLLFAQMAHENGLV